MVDGLTLSALCRREIAGDDGHGQKGEQRDPVLGIGNGQRPNGGRKKKLKASIAITETKIATPSRAVVAVPTTSWQQAILDGKQLSGTIQVLIPLDSWRHSLNRSRTSPALAPSVL
jgi:hypothetical protein